MKNNIKILKLVESGFKAQNLMSMSEKSVDALYKRLKEQIKPVTSTETKYEIGDQGGSLPPSPKGYTVKKSSDGKVMAEPNEGKMSEENLDDKDSLGKLATQKDSGEEMPHDEVDMAPDGMDDDSDNNRNEMGEQDIKDLLRGRKKKYSRKNSDRAEKVAKSDIKKHFHKHGDPFATNPDKSPKYAIGIDDPTFMIDESEIDEKAVSKQQQKFFGVVKSMQDGDTPKKGKAGEVAKEMSKKDVMDFVKTKHKGLPKKKETKENYLDMVGKAFNNNMKNKISDIKPGLTFESKVEKELTRIVEKHLPTKISKKDFINLVSESPEISPSKPKVKPGTKPNRPSTPYSPKPGPKPAPKAKGNNSPGIAPSKPTIKPGTKPNRPSTPYKPKPGPKPAPKAGNENSNIPEWLSFNKLGIELK